MTASAHPDDVRRRPIRTETAALAILGTLLGTAIRRQLWVMFLDEHDRPLPLIVPMALPSRPGLGASAGLGTFLRDVAASEGARGVVVAYERRAREDLTDTDAVWLGTIADACTVSGLLTWGPFLCHTRGVSAVQVPGR
jgi:hypothetical protein